MRASASLRTPGARISGRSPLQVFRLIPLLLTLLAPGLCFAEWVREPIAAADVRTISFHPRNARLVLAGTTSGQVYRSTDGGRSWKHAAGDLPFPGHVVARIVADPSTPKRFYAALWRLFGHGGALVRSDDSGETWTRLPLPDAQFRTVVVANGAPNVIVAGGEKGVWQSIDGGRSFRHLTPDQPEWSRVESVAIDPRTPLRIYAGTWRRAFRSDDGGESWKPIFRGMVEDSDVFSISFDPGAPDRLWATTCGWVYRSTDRGGSWNRHTDGFLNRRVHGLARAIDGALLSATCGGLHLSCDGGYNWQIAAFEGETISDVVTDPHDPAHILLSVEDDGIYSSGDGGTTWQRTSAGLAGGRILAARTRNNGSVLALVQHGQSSRLWERERWGSWAPALQELPLDEGDCAEADGVVLPVPGIPARGLCKGPDGDRLLLTGGCGLYREIGMPATRTTTTAAGR